MNRSLFEGLIQDAVREITDRHPDYFAHYAVEVPPLEKLAYQNDLVHALSQGLQILQEDGILVHAESAQSDLISRVILDSIVDAYSAARGDISLRPAGRVEANPLDVVTLKMTPSGVQYALSQRTARPLLIVSSTGIPLGVWSRALQDPELARRFIVVQSRGTSLVKGGTPGTSSLLQDVADIKEVLLAEDLTEVDIVAWCNGSRVALELIRSMGDRVAGLLLLAPSFFGAVDAEDYPSPFEESLPRISSMLKNDPSRAPFFHRCMSQVAVPADLQALKDQPEKRVTTMLGLPPHSIARDLLMPFSTVDSFRNYVDRITNDAGYDIEGALHCTRCPIVLLTGTHDTAINSLAARAVIARRAGDVVHVSLKGAGHHMQWLQYAYFRYVLECFLMRVPPASTARLTVQRLAA